MWCTWDYFGHSFGQCSHGDDDDDQYSGLPIGQLVVTSGDNAQYVNGNKYDRTVDDVSPQ